MQAASGSARAKTGPGSVDISVQDMPVLVCVKKNAAVLTQAE